MATYEQTLIDMINSAQRAQKAQPLILGGVASDGGGAGGPPGGFIGFLPQSRVAYDSLEASSGTTAERASLVDNLNHIRGRITSLEAGGSLDGLVAGDGITITSGIDPGTVVIAATGTLPELDADKVVITNNLGEITTSSGIQFNSEYNALTIGDSNPPLNEYRNAFQIVADQISALTALWTWGAGLSSLITGFTSRGTADAPEPVLANDTLLRIQAVGYDGVNPPETSLSATRISSVADEDFSDTAHGSRIDIYTTPVGSTTKTLALTIGSDQSTNIPAGSTYNVDGSPHTHAAEEIVSGTIDGNLLPGLSPDTSGSVPPTGTPSGKVLTDYGTWVDIEPIPTFDANKVLVTDPDGNLTTDSGISYSTEYKSLNLGDADGPLQTYRGVFQQVGDQISALFAQWTWGTGLSSLISGFTSRGTKASPEAVLDGDTLLRIQAVGYDGVTPPETSLSSTRISSVADEDFSDTAHGSRIDIYTTPLGSTTKTLALSVGSDQNVNLTSGHTYNIDGAPHTHDFPDFSIPLLTSDPVSPTDGEMWLLRETITPIADGTTMGLLLALTYTGNPSTVLPLKLSVNDGGTTRRLQFI